MENNYITKRSISIVSTQMQLINCVETICKLGCVQNELIVYSATVSTLNTIKMLLKTESYRNLFEKIDIYYVDYKNIIENAISINKFRKHVSFVSNNNYNYCISGNYRFDVYKYFLYKITKNNNNCIPVLIDDGLAMLNIAKIRGRDIKQKHWQVEYTSLINKVILGSYSFNTYNLKQIYYYTIYNLLPSGNDIVFKQEYSYIRKNNINLGFKNIDWSKYKAIFLGQPLIKFGYCTKEEYNSHIKKALNIYKNIIYIPHPAEDCLQIDDDLVNSVRVENFKFCFEIIVASLPPTITICSFFTSVMPNIKWMGYENPLVAFYVNVNDNLSDDIKVELKRTYDLFDSLSISVIK